MDNLKRTAFIVLCLVVGLTASARANVVEQVFIRAGLVDWSPSTPRSRSTWSIRTPVRIFSERIFTAGSRQPTCEKWWHFNGLPKAEARRRFAIIE
jgi:hypothetical protein